MEKLYTSCNLCSIPFLSNTDTTRLQMSSKQLGQTLGNLQCEVPKVIGSNYRYLSNSSSLFKLTASLPGEIIYTNGEILILIYHMSNGKDDIQIFPVPWVMACSSLYGTRLRYKREVGKFNAGDLIYEYDAFYNQIPTYGYNIMTAYMPFFGLIYF